MGRPLERHWKGTFANMLYDCMIKGCISFLFLNDGLFSSA